MHKAKAVIICCIDFRFHKEIQKWLENNHYLGEIDEISIAGASKDIAAPKEKFHYDFMMRQLEISIKLHDPDEIIILDHEDCGGYKDLIPDGTTPEQDKSKHSEYLEKASQIIKSIYPSKAITKLYIRLDKEVEKIS